MPTFIENIPKEKDDTTMDDYNYTKTKYSLLKKVLLKSNLDLDYEISENGVMDFVLKDKHYQLLFFPYEEYTLDDGSKSFGSIIDVTDMPENKIHFCKNLKICIEPEDVIDFIKDI